MKRHTTISLLALLLMISLLISSCNGGQQGNQPAATSAVTASQQATPGPSAGTVDSSIESGYDGPDKDIVTPKGTLPITKETVTLRMAIVQNARISDYYENEYTKMLEENTGVKFEFEMLPSKDARSKVKLMFASNDLPDVLTVAGQIDDASILEYGQDGMLIALDPYIELFGDEVYSMWEMAEDKNLRAAMTFADGHIYSLPKYSEQYINLYNNRCFLYGPWLEALNLEPAKTTDEFTELLRAFKNGDPNGNGKADEIPLVGFSDGGGYQPMLNFFLNAFVYWGQSDNMVVENGVVSPAYTKDAFKDALMWLNSLVREGLLDPVTFTQDEAQLKALMNQEEMIIGSFAQSTRTGVLDTTGERSKAMVAQPPLTGPDGVCYSAATPPSAQRAWLITSVCQTPAVAYRLGDYMLKEEVMMFARYGVEGRDWQRVDDPSALGIDGEPAKFQLLREVWQMDSQNVHWQWPNPGYMPYGVNESQLWNGDPTDYNYFQLQYGLKYIKGKQPDECMPEQLVMTEEEMEIHALYGPTIKSYVRENTARFIVGDRSFDEWDAYIAEFEKMNLPKLVEALQSTYTRMAGQ